MLIKNLLAVLTLIVPLQLFAQEPAGCGTEVPPSPTQEEIIKGKVDPVVTAWDIPEYVVLIGNKDKVLYAYEKGINQNSPLTIASASKWISGAVILHSVDKGLLDINSYAPDGTTTLEQLLSFTSGYSIEPACISNYYTITLQKCAANVMAQGKTSISGSTFDYGPTHLQIAGAMVETAEGKPFYQVSDSFLASLGINNTHFYKGTEKNPRIAGGIVSTTSDYSKFLMAIQNGKVLSPELATVWNANHTLPPITSSKSPVPLWDYSLAHWVENEFIQNKIVESKVQSSAGLYGFYPWINYNDGLWGIIGLENHNADATQHSLEFGFEIREALK